MTSGFGIGATSLVYFDSFAVALGTIEILEGEEIVRKTSMKPNATFKFIRSFFLSTNSPRQLQQHTTSLGLILLLQ
jgi:hypothetical protein